MNLIFKFHVKHTCRMKKLLLSSILLSSLLSFSTTNYTHPIHISIAEVDYFSQKQEIQVALKIFTDDLESAIRKEERSVYLDTSKEVGNADSYIENYVHKHFKIKINNKENLPISYVGKEYIDDATWIYFSYKTTKKVKSITIKNAVIVDLHDSQRNIVHLKKDRKLIDTKHFTKKQTSFTFNIK